MGDIGSRPCELFILVGWEGVEGKGVRQLNHTVYSPALQPIPKLCGRHGCEHLHCYYSLIYQYGWSVSTRL